MKKNNSNNKNANIKNANNKNTNNKNINDKTNSKNINSNTNSKKNKSNNYIFYLTMGTIPSLYSEINVFLDDTPSYLFVRSMGHFNPKCLKELKHVKFYYQFTGYDKDYIEDQYKVVRDRILEVKNQDKKAKFIVYIEDNRAQFYLKPFMEANALDDVTKVILLSEGSASVAMYYNLKEDDEKDCEYRWNKMIEEPNDADFIKIDHFAFWLSTKKNVSYELPCFDLYVNTKISDEYRNRMKTKKLELEKMYNQLTSKQKKYICDFKDIKIDKEKKYLIILGTINFGNDGLTTAIVENLINQVYDDYQDYIIMYKPHPLGDPKEFDMLQGYLAKKNIKILSSKFPLEVMLWEYKNVSIGGFSSSLAGLIDPKIMKFIFATKTGYVKLIYPDDSQIKTYNVSPDSLFATHLVELHYKNIEKISSLEAEMSTLKYRIFKLEGLTINGLIKRITRRIKRSFAKKLKK